MLHFFIIGLLCVWGANSMAVTVQELWEKQNRAIFHEKNSEMNIAPKELQLIAGDLNFMSTSSYKKREDTITAFKNNYYIFSLGEGKGIRVEAPMRTKIRDVLVANKYKEVSDFKKKGDIPPYDERNFDEWGVSKKFFKELQGSTYRFYTLRLVSEDKRVQKSNKRGDICYYGRTCCVFFFYNQEDEFVGSISGIK